MTVPHREFNGERLRLAAKLRGLTVISLAERLGVSRRSISAYFKGDMSPSDQIVETIAAELDLPPAFFFGESLDVPDPQAVSFRSLSRMRAVDRDTALGYGAIAIEFANWIDSRFKLPKPDLPDLSMEDDPELAAMYVRQHWGWGQQPIPNMIHLLEKHGVKVFSMTVNSDDVDAFSMWHDTTPYVFLNIRKSGERSRFDAAHELGHLILHRHNLREYRDAEREAHAFASAFLMPRGSVVSSVNPHPSLDVLVKKKKRWGVSVAALAHRCHQLRLLSDWEYRTVNVQISKLGYRVQEPEPIERESSQVLGKIISSVLSEGGGRDAIAHDLSISLRDLDSLMQGLTLTAIMGKDSRGTGSPTNRPALKVINS